MKKISVCGKGGTGKSVLVALLSGVMADKGFTVLVIDSDESNPGLYRMLGFKQAPKPIIDLFGGERHVIEELKNISRGSGADPLAKSLGKKKLSLADISGEYLVESGRLKLVSIGKISAAFEGCACPINQVSRMFLEKLSLKDKEVVIMDTEAGVEHFGRGVDEAIDTVLVPVEPSFESVALAAKINLLASGMGISQVWAVLNKVPSDKIEEKLRGELAKRTVKVIGVIHFDEIVSEACLEGKPLGDSRAKQEVAVIVDTLLKN